jgi:hypothetical protein
MFAAYFDDSQIGTYNSPGAVLSMACVVASPSQWTAFLSCWTELLAAENIKSLHMTRLANKRGPFQSGWVPEREKFLLQRAHKIIRETTEAGFNIGVDLKAYAEVPPQFSEWMGGPHGFAVFVCLLLLAKRARAQQYSQQISCFFERRSGYGKAIFNLQNRISADTPLRDWLKPVKLKFSFTSGREYPQFQAADILAYEGSKEWFNGYLAQPQVRRRKSLDNLLRLDGRDFGHFYDRARLRRFVKIFLNTKVDDHEIEPEPPLTGGG